METQEVLDAILRRINDAGGRLVVPVKSLAAELGLKPQRLYYLIERFESKGQLATASRGPNGTELRPGTGRPTPPPQGRRRLRAGRAAAGAAAPRGTRTGRYCPWCGKQSQPQWRYCAACGQRLPGRA